MKEAIGRESPLTKEVIRQALLFGVQPKLDFRGGATLVRLENGIVPVKDIRAEYFQELPGVYRVISAIQFGW